MAGYVMSPGKFALSSAFAAALLSATPASACNFLQDLFGACRPQAAPEAEASPSLETKLPAEKKPVRQAHAAAPPRKQTPLAPPEGALSGSIAHFAADSTLRKGDIVVTPGGYMVFSGAPGADRMQAFAPIDAKNAQLAEMQNETLKSDWTATTKPSLSGLAAQQATQKKPGKHGARRVAAKAAPEQM